MLIETEVKVTCILTIKQHMFIKGKYYQMSLIAFLKETDKIRLKKWIGDNLTFIDFSKESDILLFNIPRETIN